MELDLLPPLADDYRAAYMFVCREVFEEAAKLITASSSIGPSRAHSAERERLRLLLLLRHILGSPPQGNSAEDLTYAKTRLRILHEKLGDADRSEEVRILLYVFKTRLENHRSSSVRLERHNWKQLPVKVQDGLRAIWRRLFFNDAGMYRDFAVNYAQNHWDHKFRLSLPVRDATRHTVVDRSVLRNVYLNLKYGTYNASDMDGCKEWKAVVQMYAAIFEENYIDGALAPVVNECLQETRGQLGGLWAELQRRHISSDLIRSANEHVDKRHAEHKARHSKTEKKDLGWCCVIEQHESDDDQAESETPSAEL